MNWLRRFMYGRYGGDQLSWFLLAVYMILVFLSGLPHLELLSWLATLVLLVLLPYFLPSVCQAPGGKCPVSDSGRAGYPLVQNAPDHFKG